MTGPGPFLFENYRPRELEIVDTTLREGSQTSLLHDHYKYFFSLDDKREILEALIVYGVKFVELFAPVVSPREREDFTALKEVRDGLITQKGYTFLLAHARCHPADVEAALEAGFDGLNLYFGTSPAARRFSHGVDLEEMARRAERILEDVRKNHPGLVLRFSGEDAFRTPTGDLFRVYDRIAPYVDRLGAPDTVGVATPPLVEERVRLLRERYPALDLEGHFHADRGFALPNALAAAGAGMRYIDTTVLGIGERSGITSMTALLYNLYIEGDYDRLEGYHLRGSYPINVLLADKLKMLVPAAEPVSLTNRTHTAGVHQKAVLNDPSTYEAHPLDRFGVSESEILLGPLSGWNVIHYYLGEIKGFRLSRDKAKEIAKAFKEEVYKAPPGTKPADFLVSLAENRFGLTRLAHPEAFKDTLVQRMDAPENGPPPTK